MGDRPGQSDPPLHSDPPVLIFVEENYDRAYLFCDEFKKMAPTWDVMHLNKGWAAMHRLSRDAAPRALVINLDVMGVGCRDLLEWTREQPQLELLCIVVYSDSNDPFLRQRCASLGVSGFLPKPTALKELRAQIRHIVKLCQEAGAPTHAPKEAACV